MRAAPLRSTLFPYTTLFRSYNCRMDIFKVFTLEAAHRLPNVPDGHKCARLHGHSFRVEIHLKGEIGAESGWVDRKSTRLNSSHLVNSYAVFCLNKKTKDNPG